ncbi:MAG TPA: hypothetical protein VJL10_10675 [Anaerolineales bacterium]|nr:hypothetical protein [Anaerolineales bacterium]
MGLILDRVCDVHRLSADLDNANKEAYVAYAPLANIAINWQPATAEDTVIAGVVFGQAYTAFTTASGILEGDKLVMQQTGEVFIVRGKSNWNSPDLAPHTELLLTEFETTE